MAPRNEVHVSFPLGHEHSTDCWCEPTVIYWHTNIHGILMLVVVHDDDAHIHRDTRIACRERDKAVVPDDDKPWGLDAPWITRALERVWRADPPEPHERSI